MGGDCTEPLNSNRVALNPGGPLNFGAVKLNQGTPLNVGAFALNRRAKALDSG